VHILILNLLPQDRDDYRERSKSAWWTFLGKLEAVDELELHIDDAEAFWDAWKEDNTPACSACVTEGVHRQR